MNLPPALERLVHLHTGQPLPFRASQMPGGASTRSFFRIELGSGTAVAMFVPDAQRSEEVSKSNDTQDRWPFLEVRELLANHGIRVPALLAEACADGLVLVEDLGDDTLASHLESHPHERESLYQLAVRDLAHAQQRLRDLPPNSVVRQRAFDRDLLRWEVDHFREWALEAEGVVLSRTERKQFDAYADHLAGSIADWPRSFVHRDYQSRNLMVVRAAGGETDLAWIDFQDALLGPRVYDLVALLSDSYQTFDRAFIERRLDEYVTHRGLLPQERVAVGREFDLVTAQRKLKDAGRFVFIDRKKGDGSFLQYVDSTIAKVRAALERIPDPELEGFDTWLERVLARRR